MRLSVTFGKNLPVELVRPKKSLGQHYLEDRNIAQKIVGSLTFRDYDQVLEIGPGTGVLTGYLLSEDKARLRCIEIDKVSVALLSEKYPQLKDRIVQGDVLDLDLTDMYDRPFAIIGNFPYNISSQIFFRILQYRHLVHETVCMVQKEVAQRIVTPPGSKAYGILSVLLQTFYTVEHLFNVGPHVFIPPPKVNSSVIRLRRNERQGLACDEAMYFKVVKTAFNQRRKTLRNALKPLGAEHDPSSNLMHLRPEQLGVEDFIRLTASIENASGKGGRFNEKID
jgi:16S rRNA (adenine1518-N6/adenine1519-N6)-dimethyltransferase